MKRQSGMDARERGQTGSERARGWRADAGQLATRGRPSSGRGTTHEMDHANVLIHPKRLRALSQMVSQLVGGPDEAVGRERWDSL